MKKLIAILILALICTSCTVSKRMTYLQLPVESQNTGILYDISAFDMKYGKYDGVFLMHEDVLEHSGTKESVIGSSNWNFHHVHKEKYMILNPDSKELTTIDFWIKPREMYIIVTSPEGKATHYTMLDLQAVKDEYGGKNYSFAIPDVSKGTVVDMGYDISFPGQYALDREFPLQHSIPCEKLSFSYAYPEWWDVRVKQIAPGKTPEKETVNDIKNKKKIIKYNSTNIPPITKEPFAPFFKEYAKYIQLMVTNLKMGHMSLNMPTEWNKLVDDYMGEIFRDSQKHSKIVRQVADSIIQEISEPKDKLQAIIGFVQNNIEESDKGLKGNCKKIIENKKGDILDKTTLALALLNSAELNATLLLIHSATDGYFDPTYISSDQLIMPALHVPLDSTDYVVFPFIENLPINHIPEAYQGQDALIINEISEDQFWTVPEGNSADNVTFENYKLIINEDGSLEVVEEKTFLGFRAYFMREVLSKLNQNETEDMVDELLTYQEGEVKLLEYNFENLEDYLKPLVLKLKYNISNLITVTPDELIFQTGGLFSPTSIKEYSFDPQDRLNPIRIYYEEKFIKNISITYPGKWSLYSELKDIEFDNLFGKINGRYETNDNILEVEQEVILKKSKASREKVADLMDLIGQTSKLHVPTLIFDKSNPDLNP